MRKILFGTIVLFSLAFLASCGGGGSGSGGAAGTAGTAGADGAAGATGSIALFEDTNLLASFNGAAGALPGATPTAVPLDSGAVIGVLSGLLTVTGVDNLTAESRNRYYQYTETSAGVQSGLSCGTDFAVCTTTAEGGVNTKYDVDDDGIFDTRVLGAVTGVTNTLVDYALPDAAAADGVSKTTAYVSVCPGNAAGDGACSKVLAPAYDRGIATSATAFDAGKDTVVASIAYAGSSFHIISDNGTSAAAKTSGFRIGAFPKTGFATALTSDNTSAVFFPNPLMDDNGTMTSNLIVRAANTTYGRSTASVWFAISGDNMSGLANAFAEGDNVTLVSRADGTADFTDNGTAAQFGNAVVWNVLELTTAPQIADSGEGVYVLLGSGTTVSGVSVRDNATKATLTPPTTLLVADNWCSTSSGVVGEGIILVSDNDTNGWIVDQLYDNSSTFNRAGISTNYLTDDQVATSFCAASYHGGKYYVAVSDVTTVLDNVSVWSSTDAITWAQIGADLAMTGTVASLAIGHTGATASDDGVWVAVNDGGDVKLLHYEDIAGGSTYAWRSVGTLFGTAAATGVDIATDGTNIIAVSAVVIGDATVGFWYNQ